MFHSDRGSQYTSLTFRKLIADFDLIQSFSGRGCPYDNSVAESFFKYLKKEETCRKSYSDFRICILRCLNIMSTLLIILHNFITAT